ISASQDSRSRDNGPDGMEPEVVIKSNWNEIVDSFDDMNLSESLLRGIYAYGFEKSSAIQTGSADTKGGHGTRRLHGCLQSCIHWGHQCTC
uniref:DEAD-box RNA helicase Q domain-containing protein n=1 Tax=Spermophilus dauricus TaxID=99837 RepID=A0A8C9PQB1_SPEDA